METKHTPTPWKAIRSSSFWDIDPVNRKDGDPHSIGNVCSSDPDDSTGLQEANAAFIVKCVNAHDELVKALESALKNLRHHSGDRPDFDEVFAPEIAALTKAGANHA
jgi:hypothetical protein